MDFNWERAKVHFNIRLQLNLNRNIFQKNMKKVSINVVGRISQNKLTI
jgi:hypothetical protein